MRIVLIILLILVLLTVLVCLSGAVISFSFWSGQLEWSVKYLGIQILPRKKKKPSAESTVPEKPAGKEKKKKKTAAKKKKRPAKEEEKSPFLMDKILDIAQNIAGKADLAGNALAALPPSLPHLLHGIKWYQIETDICIGGEDAADTARLYGKVQTAVQLLLALTGTVIQVRRRQIAIGCDFTADKSDWNVRFRLRIRVGAVLGMGILFVWYFLKDRILTKKKLVREKL